MDFRVIFIPLLAYPIIMLYFYAKNKRWISLVLLIILDIVALLSLRWAYAGLEEGLCTAVFILPFYTCIYINFLCGVINLVSFLYNKRKKKETLYLKRTENIEKQK